MRPAPLPSGMAAAFLYSQPSPMNKQLYGNFLSRSMRVSCS
jgi:hypothetical protein